MPLSFPTIIRVSGPRARPSQRGAIWQRCRFHLAQNAIHHAPNFTIGKAIGKELRRLRAARVKTPVLILSGLNGSDDKIKGLGVGADDYLTKPFDKRVKAARNFCVPVFNSQKCKILF